MEEKKYKPRGQETKKIIIALPCTSFQLSGISHDGAASNCPICFKLCYISLNGSDLILKESIGY